ncbi:MAG: hypothetical protein HDS45_04360 [Bacteroides sp.]|nr:hypothetical protein [Bacteroides sp.]
MTKIQSSIIPLSIPSSLPDILAKDGEVENFMNIPWLSDELENADNSGNSGNNSSKPSSNPAFQLALNFVENSNITFPPASTLLFIHNAPASEELLYFFRTGSGALGYIGAADGRCVYIPGISSSLAASIHTFLPAANFIRLISSSGISYLLPDKEGKDWIFAGELPTAPDLSVGETAAHVPGYTLTAGNYPTIRLSIPLSSTSDVSLPLIQKWISGEDSAALSAANSEKIIKSIFDALINYFRDAMNAGKFLYPPAVIAAYGMPTYYGHITHHIPSLKKSTYTDLADFPVSIEDFGWWNGILSLELLIHRLPLDITAILRTDENIEKWQLHFTSLALFIDEPADLTASGAFSDLPESPRNRRLTFSLSQKMTKALSTLREGNISGSRSYRLAKSTSTSGLRTWMTTIPRPSVNASSYTPDYSDCNRYFPEVATHAGSDIISRGYAEIFDETGECKRQYVTQSLFFSNSESPLFFSRSSPLPCQKLLAMGTSPSVGFFEEAVRKFSFSSDGLKWGEIVANVPAISPEICPTDAGTAFISSRGIEFLSLSSKISTLFSFSEIREAFEESELASEIELTEGDETMIEALRYDYPGNALLITLRPMAEINRSILMIADLSPADAAPSFSLQERPPVPHNHHLHIIQNPGLCTLRIERKKSPNEVELQEEELQKEGLQKAELQIENGEKEIYFRTRPLKLGNPFRLKRISEINSDIENATAIIEGSRNLADWHILADLTLPAYALRLPSCRYHRITLRAPATTTPPHLLFITHTQ